MCSITVKGDTPLTTPWGNNSPIPPGGGLFVYLAPAVDRLDWMGDDYINYNNYNIVEILIRI